MSLPLNRREFAEFCLRQLGKGAIHIEVTDEQVDDAIDIALQWYVDYNAEAVEKVYYKHQITSDDITNKWVPIPENIIGVVNIFPLGDAMNINNMFSIRYQIALNDLYTLANVSLVPYYMTMQHLRTIEEDRLGHTDRQCKEIASPSLSGEFNQDILKEEVRFDEVRQSEEFFRLEVHMDVDRSRGSILDEWNPTEVFLPLLQSDDLTLQREGFG